VHAVDAAGRVVVSRSLSREKFLAWCACLPPGCMVAMEASSGAHHWARELLALGLDARVVSAQLAAPYREEGPSAKKDASNEMNALARLTLERAAEHWREIDEHLAWCDQRIAQHAQDNAEVRRAAELIGIGPVTASALVAAVGDFKQFKNAAQFGAWLGLVPRQHSSGGKSSLGGITKHGQTYLRMLLVQGAKSAVMTAHRRKDRISGWVAALRERSGWQKAVVALANKNARIVWALMTRAEHFDAAHVSVKPA
jgi:transposase